MVVDFDDVSRPQIRPSKLAHVVLRTPDKAAMSKFYVDFLGATIVHENQALSFITYDDEHHRIALAQIPSLKPKDRGICGLEVG
jgi:catechol-2,3-dioxygenase